jgi:phytoene/squalene synthetase
VSLLTPGLDGWKADGSALKASSFSAGALLLDAQASADLRVFYDYCRAIDDCADEFAPALAKRHLRRWKKELRAMARAKAGSDLGRRLTELCARRQIPLSLLEDLWSGAFSDAKPKVRLGTWDALRHYAYQVAGAVGLACLPIFGAPMDQAGRFALALGEAFQLINIIRDVKEDLGRGRLYLALEDLKDYGVAESDLISGKASPQLERLLHAYAWRARHALFLADQEAAKLPRQRLRPPLLMRAVYGALLEQMAADGFKVFERRYQLAWLKKRALVLRALVLG